MPSLPATDLDARQAGGLLDIYGFTRHMFGAVQLWVRDSGAFQIRLAITAGGRARLSLACRLKSSGLYGEHRPWSVELGHRPTTVAAEAVAFVCVVEGLCAPTMRGYTRPASKTRPRSR